MSGLFFTGLITLFVGSIILFFVWREVYLYNKRKKEGGYYYTDISKKEAITITIGIALVSLFCLIYGCFTYSPHLSHRYDHHNGYMTVVEYNMRGDSIIKENIRTPKTTYGKVIDSQKGHHFVGVVGKGGHSVTHYWITVKLDDGREIKERYTGSSYGNYKVGYKVRYEEVFYPHYHWDLKFE